MKNVNLKEVQELIHHPDLPESLRNLLYTFGEIPTYNLKAFAYKVKCHIQDSVNPTIDEPLLKKLLDKATIVEDGEGGFHARLWDALYKEEKYSVFATHIPSEYDFCEDGSKLLTFLERYADNEAYRFSLLWLAKNQPEYLLTENNAGDDKDQNV